MNLNGGYSFGGRKFEHALKHGPKNGLFIVTLGWFVESVKRNGMEAERCVVHSGYICRIGFVYLR